MAPRSIKPTRWSIRQHKRWIPLLGETFGGAYVQVRLHLMHGTVLFAAFLTISMVWDATMVQLTGDVLGVVSVVFFCTAAIVSLGIPTFRLLQLQAKVAKHLRANGVSIRHWPDLRDSVVYLAWCRREGLEPDRVASVLSLPPREPVS